MVCVVIVFNNSDFLVVLMVVSVFDFLPVQDVNVVTVVAMSVLLNLGDSIIVAR